MSDKTRIFFANGDPVTRDFFEVMLTKFGFSLTMETSGERVLDRLETERPDILILDAELPDLSGWEIVTLLKRDPRWEALSELPVILFSDSTSVRDRIAAFELGVEDFISKPFNFSEILARIRSIVKHQHLAARIAVKRNKLAAVSSLRQSFVYFADHIRDPLNDLKNTCGKLDVSRKDQVESFIQDVKKHADQTLAALEALEEEVEELDSAGAFDTGSENLLKDLEEKYLRHFSQLREPDSVNG